MEYLSWDLGNIGPEDTVEVTLKAESNIRLLTPSDFDKYKNGNPFEYYGGNAKYSPFQINPPFQGHWYLTVDLGGSPGKLWAGVRILD
jgi:hypothetical protein